MAPDGKTGVAFAAANASREEILRAHDRMHVQNARRLRKPLLLALLLVGPGILTMLAENDGPSMISYLATGAQYGVGFFIPLIALTFAMAYVVQETATRIGIASGRGHAELIRDRFGRGWAAFTLIDLTFGNTLTLAAEFVAVASGAAFLGVPRAPAVGAAAGLVAAAFAARRYFTWERAALLLALCNLLFVPVALRAHPHPEALARALLLWQPAPHHPGAAFLTLILANVGATVTPWMIFFQQSAVVDKGLCVHDLRHARFDTALGAALAAAVAMATVSIGAVLYVHRVDVGALRSSADFAGALLPYVGRHASTLFALAMIEAGLTASVTISASSGYAAGEIFGRAKSLNRTFREGMLFYGVILLSLGAAAGSVLIPHAPLFGLAIAANVAATLFMGPALIFVWLLARDRAVMGSLANGRVGSSICGVVTAAVCMLGAFYGLSIVIPALIAVR